MLGHDGTVSPLQLRVRPDVRKSLPSWPHTTGFFGLGRLSQMEGQSITIRLRTEGESEDCGFLLENEPEAELLSRFLRGGRIYPHLVCVRCRSRFPEGGIEWGEFVLRCPGCGASYDCSDGYYNFLSEEQLTTLAPTTDGNISANHYDLDALKFIHELADGLILDCGAGLRLTQYPNVVNLEIVPYRTTDVLALNERLPFADATFDGVLSLAVLEHVRDPFASAREISRVLKRGGRVMAVVPFLQPLHAYPNHFYNMTPEGLLNLFPANMEVVEQKVPASGLPIWALTWILRSWSEALPEAARSSFQAMRVADLLGEGSEYLTRDFVAALPAEKNVELASTTLLVARKK